MTLRLHVLSDLHLEFAALPRRQVAAVPCDVHILAGDIGVGLLGLDWALATFTRPVIYVMGNHEFYGKRTVPDLWRAAYTKVRGTHVHLLENAAVVIEGVRFLGATLWTDLCLGGYLSFERTTMAVTEIMNDYTQIRLGRYPKWPLTPAMACAWHDESAAFLEHALVEPASAPGDSGALSYHRTVVVTHHAPHPQSLGKKPPYTAEDAAYASDLSDLVAHADLWIHGHIHTHCDYRLPTPSKRSMRVIANPRGYDGMVPVAGFDARWTVEV